MNPFHHDKIDRKVDRSGVGPGRSISVGTFGSPQKVVVCPGPEPIPVDLDLAPITDLLTETNVCLEVIKRGKPAYIHAGYTIDTCEPVFNEIACDAAGQVIMPYPMGTLVNGVFTLTDSANFTPNKPENFPPIIDNVYATNTADGDPQVGRYIPLQSRTPYDVTLGGYDNGATTYHDESNLLNDVTAIVTAAPYQIDANPIRKQVGYEEFQITSDTALPNIPPTARYAEVYYNAQDGNVLWTVGGASVTDNFSEDENGGVTVRIYGPDNIAAYLGSSADGDGVLDGVAVRNASVLYSNISPEEMG